MKVVCKLEEILAEKEEEGTKITKAEIARKLGISKQAMTNIARGKTEPKLKNALMIAHIVGKRIDEIWKLEEIE